ncbi:hypothetical protein EHI47_14540 [Rhizobium leguminosarum]|uniref:Uncharacterized protein n=1 Tax=Rhizobium leguminosarum TaxID=384 RepID=A0A444I111_RHILE|nr:hypothetical protein [Rhizobium leguminosarum]RWX30665.1 hypothetical protein EHI47_14540 [Rhizobium leguminosarum]
MQIHFEEHCLVQGRLRGSIERFSKFRNLVSKFRMLFDTWFRNYGEYLIIRGNTRQALEYKGSRGGVRGCAGNGFDTGSSGKPPMQPVGAESGRFFEAGSKILEAGLRRLQIIEIAISTFLSLCRARRTTGRKSGGKTKKDIGSSAKISAVGFF